MRISLKVLFCILIVPCLIQWPLRLEAQGSDTFGRLIYEGTVTGKDLCSVASVEVSADGKHLYSTSFNPGIVNVYDRDTITGQIARKDSYSNLLNLAGSVSIRLSDNNKLAAVASFRSTTVSLYERDPATGKLNQLYIVRNQEAGVTGLWWVVDAAFSPDSRFIYTIDGQRGNKAKGSVTVFGITDDNSLKWIESNEGKEKCLDGARGICIHPNGKALYVSCSQANTLVVLRRNKKTGKTKIKQIIHDEADNIHGLGGAFGVDISPDKRFIYTTSGRFGGDNAVSVFRIKSNYKLTAVQELQSSEQGLGDFSGGNEILVSPDGRNVYVSGTTSNTIVNLQRDEKTGILKYLETINKDTMGPGGLVMSPDGDFLYVAAELGCAITIFRRITK